MYVNPTMMSLLKLKSMLPQALIVLFPLTSSKNRLKRLRDNLESNELSRQTIADF